MRLRAIDVRHVHRYVLDGLLFGIAMLRTGILPRWLVCLPSGMKVKPSKGLISISQCNLRL